MFTASSNPTYEYSSQMAEDFEKDESEVISGKSAIRDFFGGVISVGDNADNAKNCIWKYKMGDVDNTNIEAIRINNDANWIMYRMADVMLMKAEALIWKGKDNWQEAIDIINKIRTRANLTKRVIVLEEEDEASMMENYLLPERNIELAAEGKRWYDLLRYGKSKSFAHKTAMINIIQKYNNTANDSWLRSALQNEYAWYLPINASEIENNNLLVQNPYYGKTKKK